MQSALRRLEGAVRKGFRNGECSTGCAKRRKGSIGRAIMTVVMGLIIVSFVIWGVGDMLRGFTSTTVASVGSTKITQQEFRDSYQRTLQQYQRRLRQPITNEQARAIGLDNEVLQRLISEAALDNTTASARPWRLRDRAPRDDHVEPGLPQQGRPVRPADVRERAARQRPQRTQLRRRIAQDRAAPVHRRRADGRRHGAQGRGRGGGRLRRPDPRRRTISFCPRAPRAKSSRRPRTR